MNASRAKRQNKLQSDGYEAALAGLPCEAPTSNELDRGAWEQGWRSGKRELKMNRQHEAHVAVFDPVDRQYYVATLSNVHPTRYTIQRHLGPFDITSIDSAILETRNRG